MDNQALIRLEAIRQRNADRDWVNQDLYRLLYKPDLFEVAYQRIKSRPGNMTPGSDGETLDGFSFTSIQRVIASLRDESFQFKPSRRTIIPKANGKLRPLGISSPQDKVVQEAIRMILEAIYDSPHGPFFLETSHGFRPNRSCHTALKEFSDQWIGVVWIIEGDIKSCFDEIEHQILMDLLKRKIADGRFLNLIWKALRAGYLWGKERIDAIIGSPQGSIISPILANIYLHELDCFVEQLQRKYQCGEHRRRNPEYLRVKKRRSALIRRLGDPSLPQIRELTRQMRSLPSYAQEDPDFVRVKYIRYADDWLVGVIGPRSLAEAIKEEIRQFLKEKLKLTLSEEKTKISHAKTEEANFLGVRLSVGSTTEAKIIRRHLRDGRIIRGRGTGWLPILKAPVRQLVAKLHQKGFCDATGKPTSQQRWVLLGADQIIRLFNSILRGLLNYYAFVDNFQALARIQYILRFSLAKTLAHKFRSSVRQIMKKHGHNLRFQWQLKNGQTREVAFEENTDWKVKKDAFAVRPYDIDLLIWQKSLLTKSALGFPCLICGSTEGVQMHHVRHIRKMDQRRPTGFLNVMRALNRKQVPVCEACHRKIHNGEYDGISLKDLAYDFTATRSKL